MREKNDCKYLQFKILKLFWVKKEGRFKAKKKKAIYINIRSQNIYMKNNNYYYFCVKNVNKFYITYLLRHEYCSSMTSVQLRH